MSDPKEKFNYNAAHRFLVVNWTNKIIAMNLTSEEATKICEGQKHYYIGNMFNHFEEHDCKNSEENGCQICQLLSEII